MPTGGMPIDLSLRKVLGYHKIHRSDECMGIEVSPPCPIPACSIPACPIPACSIPARAIPACLSTWTCNTWTCETYQNSFIHFRATNTALKLLMKACFATHAHTHAHTRTHTPVVRHSLLKSTSKTITSRFSPAHPLSFRVFSVCNFQKIVHII